MQVNVSHSYKPMVGIISLYVGLEVHMTKPNTFNLHPKLPQKRAFIGKRGGGEPKSTSSPSPIPQNRNSRFHGHLWLITPIKNHLSPTSCPSYNIIPTPFPFWLDPKTLTKSNKYPRKLTIFFCCCMQM